MLRAGVVCARVALPALLAFVVMTGAERLAGTSPIQSRLQPTSVLWANRIFATRADLARWLRSRGASYETWAVSHPRLAAANSAQRAQAADHLASVVHSKGQDPTHLIALGVAGGVALLLALVLFYEKRTYDFRGRLQRAPPALAVSGGRARTTVDVSMARAARDASVSVRGRVVHPATTAAKAVASGAGPVLALARSGPQLRDFVRRFRREHPDVAWYVGACAFATAVGFVVPYMIR